MFNFDLEREYSQDFAYIKAQKEIEEWQQFEEEFNKKETKIVINYLNQKDSYDRISNNIEKQGYCSK